MIKTAVFYKSKTACVFAIVCKMVMAERTFRGRTSEGTSHKHTMKCCINYICLSQDNKERVEPLGGDIPGKRPVPTAVGSPQGWGPTHTHLLQDLYVADVRWLGDCSKHEG